MKTKATELYRQITKHLIELKRLGRQLLRPTDLPYKLKKLVKRMQIALGEILTRSLRIPNPNVLQNQVRNR